MILDKNTESKSITKGENQKNPEHLDIDRREIKKSDLIKIKKHDAYKSPVTPDEFQNNTKKNGNTIKFGQFHKFWRTYLFVNHIRQTKVSSIPSCGKLQERAGVQCCWQSGDPKKV